MMIKVAATILFPLGSLLLTNAQNPLSCTKKEKGRSAAAFGRQMGEAVDNFVDAILYLDTTADINEPEVIVGNLAVAYGAGFHEYVACMLGPGSTFAQELLTAKNDLDTTMQSSFRGNRRGTPVGDLDKAGMTKVVNDDFKTFKSDLDATVDTGTDTVSSVGWGVLEVMEATYHSSTSD